MHDKDNQNLKDKINENDKKLKKENEKKRVKKRTKGRKYHEYHTIFSAEAAAASPPIAEVFL